MSDSNKVPPTGDLKDIQKPLLDGLASPQGSDQGSNDNVKIPDQPGAINDDAVSGFTQADYLNPQKVFKNELQSKLDSFLIYFGSSAGTKKNERQDDGQIKSAVGEESEMSDGTVKSAPPDQKQDQDQQSKSQLSFNAPEDAKGCMRIDSLKQYIKNEAKLIQNPRRAYFQLSRNFYKNKYPEGHIKKQITVDSHVITQDKSNYLRHMTVDVIRTKQGNAPMVKTFEHDYHNASGFIKAIKFYDVRNDCKLLNQVKVDDGIMDETYRTFDISTLHFQNFVIFFVRYDKWLQLQKYDVIENKQEEIPGYQIEIMNPEENRLHPIFSQEFGPTSKTSADNCSNLKEFLDQQFVFCQEYRIQDGSQNEVQSLKMFSMSDTSTPIEQYGQTMGVLQEAIQKVCHIKQKNNDGQYYTFVAFDAFNSHIFTTPENLSCHAKPEVYPATNEFQLQKINELKDSRINSYQKHQSMKPFLSHDNPQFLIQKETLKLNVIQKNLEVEQYFYITNDNQFMLVYPNYTDVRQKTEVMMQLAKKHTYVIKHPDDFKYQTDYEKRQTDYAQSTHKKVSHVCYENYRSQSHIKSSQHIQDIVEYQGKFSVNHQLILSTDAERSDIYVYQTKDPSGRNVVEIYSYENNIDKASSLAAKPKAGEAEDADGSQSTLKLPKQLQEVMIEEKKYGKRMTSKKAEEDASCYYMNGYFKNVVSSKYCIKTQSKSEVDQKTVAHSLPVTDAKHFCLVEGRNVDQQQYFNLRIKHNHMKENIELQMYYRSKQYYVFVFTLVNDAQKFDRRQAFFFVRKTVNEIEELAQDNHKSIITHDSEVFMVMDNDQLGTADEVNQKYLKKIQFNDLIKIQQSPQRQEHHIHLTFETLYDMRKRYEFLPFIYQEKKSLASHHLLVLDINHMTIVGKICINSNLQIREYLRKSEAGYAMYTITRTSEIFDQKLGFLEKMKAEKDTCSQVIKYQVSHQYYIDDAEDHPNPAKCTLEFSEYLINFNNLSNTSTNIKLIGRKQLLLSEKAQFKREQTFDKLFILPYFDKSGKVKGSQLILKEDDQVIKIADQNQNKIYHCENEMMQFGQLKYITDNNSHDEYLMVVSAQLKQKVFMRGNLDQAESYYILSKIQKKVMSMQLARFEYFVLTDNFDYLMQQEFYQAQEVLQGKTVCDICLNFPKDIAKGLKFNQQNYERIDGSLMDEVCLGDQTQINFYKKIGLCEDNLMIQPDFNFVTTLRLAVELGANQSVKLLLREIFKQNKMDYQEALMLDLPKLLDKDLIERIYPFLERDHDEYMQIQEDQELLHSYPNRQPATFCNFEEFVLNPELPPFSADKIDYHVKSKFIDHHNCQQEIMCEVILKDPYMTWDINNFQDQCDDMKKKKYEVEHSLIDFQKLIIGEKVRGYQEEFKNVEFNDQHLAQLLHKEDQAQLNFYALETIQKLVDYQFIKTRRFLSLMFRLYIFGFLGPFILSITVDSLLIQNFCYIFCFFTQCFFIFFEFVQMKQYGFSYFHDFWNCIDLAQFGAFVYLFLNKLITQFQSDTFMEILFSAMILFLSIYKLMYFVRIFNSCNEIILLIQAIALELIPFAVMSMGLLFALSKIYQVLHMGVNDPQNLYRQIRSDLMKLLMQTIKLSTGDKTPPKLTQEFNDRLIGNETTKGFFIFSLELVWAVQQVLSVVFGLFAISKVCQTYEKTMQKLELLIYQSKAKFNEENFQILNLMQRQPQFKVIFFQVDKSIQRNKHKIFEGVTRSIEKILIRSDNKKKDMKKDDDKQRQTLINLQEQQIEQMDDFKREYINRG